MPRPPIEMHRFVAWLVWAPAVCGRGSAQRMRLVYLRPQPDSGHTLIDKSSMSPGADMVGLIDAVRKDELIKCAEWRSSQYCERAQVAQTDWSTRLLLDDDRA
jgi:hypothetical protein